MSFRLATWNINSVRLRMPLVKRFVEEHHPDILCLQETKVMDDLFPHGDLTSLGFSHILFSGEKSYNGVAILSKMPITLIDKMTLADIDHKRHIGVRLPDGTELHNFYVPAGGDLPDPKENPKFDHKLRFVEHMHDWSLEKKKSPMILVGDLNIAPLEHDVWSHKQMLKIVSHTPAETERLIALQNSIGWVDAIRHFVPESEKVYSWWSYRAQDWEASDRGRRLDHIWVTAGLRDRLLKHEIHKPVRGWDAPSDHVPVIVEMAA